MAKEQPPSADEITEVMRNKHGLDISAFDENFLVKAFELRRVSSASGTPANYLDRLAEDPEEVDVFFHSLTISYSIFFRSPLVFSTLEQMVLPSVIRRIESSGQPDLRIWSAGCAAGQEAYSISILLEELNSELDCSISYIVFATDSSETELALARKGDYNADNLKNVRMGHFKKYFKRQGELYSISASQKKKVHFVPYDLLDPNTISPSESIYGDFDLVFCSNVLYYYRPEYQQIIISKLKRSLKNGGYLVSDKTEHSIIESAGGLVPIFPTSGIFQKPANRR